MPDLHDLLERSAADYTPPPDLRARVSGRSRRRQRNRRVATGLAVVLVVAGIVGVLSPLQAPPGPIVSERPPALDFPELTRTFVSPRNGFSINHPERAAVTPAKQLWGFSKQVDDGFDVVETGLAAVFKGTSTPTPDGFSIDERIDEYPSGDYVLPRGCGAPRSQQAEITIDGQPGRIAECPNHIEATVATGGRLYLFTLSHDRNDARAVFDAFAATIELRPETAVGFPGLTTTFVSPTYGYSFDFLDRGGLSPATELWEPGNQPHDNIDSDERFDAVETGLGAYFQGASTPIPEGVLIDEWVDEYITPVAAGGCGVPRSQQAEITVDGQSGRIAKCVRGSGMNLIEATVVAGGRLYLFRLFSGGDDTAYFDAWMATIDLTPETVAIHRG